MSLFYQLANFNKYGTIENVLQSTIIIDKISVQKFEENTKRKMKMSKRNFLLKAPIILIST